MNRNQAIKYLPFILALAEGKTIQLSTGGSFWVDVESPSFINDTYRIKPFEIEIGKYYRTFDGRKAYVGMFLTNPNPYIMPFTGYIEDVTGVQTLCTWKIDGKATNGTKPVVADLIEEWKD